MSFLLISTNLKWLHQYVQTAHPKCKKRKIFITTYEQIKPSNKNFQAKGNLRQLQGNFHFKTKMIPLIDNNGHILLNHPLLCFAVLVVTVLLDHVTIKHYCESVN